MVFPLKMQNSTKSNVLLVIICSEEIWSLSFQKVAKVCQQNHKFQILGFAHEFGKFSNSLIQTLKYSNLKKILMLSGRVVL